MTRSSGSGEFVDRHALRVESLEFPEDADAVGADAVMVRMPSPSGIGEIKRAASVQDTRLARASRTACPVAVPGVDDAVLVCVAPDHPAVLAGRVEQHRPTDVVLETDNEDRRLLFLPSRRTRAWKTPKFLPPAEK